MPEMRKDSPIDTLNAAEEERALYDFKDEERDEDFYKVDEGLTEDIVRQISREKNDPDWMLEFRLNALKVYKALRCRTGGLPSTVWTWIIS